jgi:hypothetical protein
MKLKHEFIDDNLDRKTLAKKYVLFLNKLQGNHTIALDAPWGSGKSKFIEFMTDEFEREDEDKSKDIYITYNAWENDYTDDPFLSLMSEFFETIIKKQYRGEDKLKGIMNTTFSASKHIGKGILKGVTRSVLGSESIESLSEGIGEILKGTISETSNILINNAFKSISKGKKTRKEFTKELKSNIVKILEENSKDKFIIIIDEVDRCKPTFAIELLENIKHLFDIEKIVFFIAVDRTQLAESIKAVYGSGFDSDTYLHRFFDIELHLPKSKLEDHFKIIINETLNNEHAFTDYQCDKYLLDAINFFDLSIRDFERIVSETLLLRTINPQVNSSLDICILLLILKYKETKTYNIIMDNQSILYSQIIRKINQLKNSENLNIFLHRHSKILVGTNSISQPSANDYLASNTGYVLSMIKSTL